MTSYLFKELLKDLFLKNGAQFYEIKIFLTCSNLFKYFIRLQKNIWS